MSLTDEDIKIDEIYLVGPEYGLLEDGDGKLLDDHDQQIVGKSVRIVELKSEQDGNEWYTARFLTPFTLDGDEYVDILVNASELEQM